MSAHVQAAQYMPSRLVPLLCLIARVDHTYYLAVASVLLASFTDVHVYLRARSLARRALHHVSSIESCFALLQRLV